MKFHEISEKINVESETVHRDFIFQTDKPFRLNYKPNLNLSRNN